MVMWLGGLKPLKISHHPAKFSGHRHCGSGVMSYFVTWSHMTKWPKGHLILKVWPAHGKSNHAKFMAISIAAVQNCGSSDIMVLVCPKIWQDHMTKRIE